MIGQTILHYKILDKLGEGGMGIVYKAQDTKLDRLVALKFLPHYVESNDTERARFLQEAKAAATLNHPNICTIHDICESEGEQFIVMELVEGVTVKQKFSDAAMKVGDAINYAVQIGEALQEAHAKGIVHRDVKSENIMINSKNQIKVMDFGLAKLRGSVKLTKSSSTTGTLAYMAPEQIQGGEIDARADIFSFGVVLYEMLTGHIPFRGEHEAAMMYSILNEEPQPIQKFREDISSELLHILNRALEKDPEERYQTVKDMTIDLRRLRKESTRVVRPSGSVQIREQSETPIPEVKNVQSIKPKQNRMVLIGGIGVAAVVTIAVLYALFGKQEIVPFQKSKFTRITSSGKAMESAISPDGRYICYTERDSGKGSLWVRQIATSSNIQIVAPQIASPANLTFSPDGNFIYYTQSSEHSVIPILYRIAVLGGTPVKILADVQSKVSLSPDGKQFAFHRVISSTGDFAVMTANLDGSAEKVLSAHSGVAWFNGSPSWSPDGSTIACGLGTWKDGMHSELLAVDVLTGKEKRMTEKTWASIAGVEWLSSGAGMIVRGAERGSDRSQIYYVSHSSGEVSRITNDANQYNSSSVTTDGKNLCITQSEVDFQIHYLRDGNASNSSKITSQKDDGLNGLTIGKNGEIYYGSSYGGQYDIWTVDSAGKNQKQITSDPAVDLLSSVTPDGKSLLFSSFKTTDTPSIWRIGIDGSGRTQLTSGSEEYNPVMDPSGKRIVMASWFLGPMRIMTIPADGGERVDLSKIDGLSPILSPEGTFVYFLHRDNDSPTSSVYSIPLQGGTATRLFDLPRNASDFIRCRPGHQEFSYVLEERGADNIWICALDGSGAKRYTDFKDSFIAYFEWMPNGNSVVASRGKISRDVILISEEK